MIAPHWSQSIVILCLYVSYSTQGYEGANLIGGLLAAQDDLSEGSLAQDFQELEVFERLKTRGDSV